MDLSFENMRLGPMIILDPSTGKTKSQVKKELMEQGFIPISTGRVNAQIKKQYPKATRILYTIFYDEEITD